MPDEKYLFVYLFKSKSIAYCSESRGGPLHFSSIPDFYFISYVFILREILVQEYKIGKSKNIKYQ